MFACHVKNISYDLGVWVCDLGIIGNKVQQKFRDSAQSYDICIGSRPRQ